MFFIPYNQIFDYLDKYLIKIFLNPLIFVNYTISQQIASKLSIFSGAIISVMLPKLASQKSTESMKNVLNLHLYLFYIPISFLLILFEFSFDELLKWWLKDSFNQNFYVLSARQGCLWFRFNLIVLILMPYLLDLLVLA